MQQSLIRLPEGLGIVEWLARVVPNGKKDKMLSIFPALVFGQWEKDKTLSIFPF